MLQHVHPYTFLVFAHARVPGDDCAHIVSIGAACGAVGHDLQANAAGHEVEGTGGAVEVVSVVGALMAARQITLTAGK